MTDRMGASGSFDRENAGYADALESEASSPFDGGGQRGDGRELDRLLFGLS
jgi:hypothetical protein